MTTRRIIQLSALAFIILSVGVFSARQLRVASDGTQDAVGSAAAGQKVVVYYFHGSARCVSCRTVENHTREALEEKYADALKLGELEFLSIDVQRSEHQHYIRDFALTSLSVVAAEMRGGRRVRWKKLDRVWDFIMSRPMFIEYVGAEVGEYLRGGK